MSIAQGPRIRICYGAEVTRGTTPPNLNLQQLRTITRDIDLTKGGLSSDEQYPDGQRRDFRQGFNQVVGSFNFELSLAQQSTGTITNTGHDDLFEALLGGTWSATGTAGGSPGTLKCGTNLKTKSFERQFLDIGQYEAFAGCIPSDLTLSFDPAKIIGGTWNIMGMSAPIMSSTSIQGSGTLTTPTTAPPCDTFIGAITEGGSPIAVATQCQMTIKTGRSLSPVIGSKFSPDIFMGTILVSGTLSAFFQDNSLATKFYNEVNSTLVLTANELPTSGQRKMVFTLPNIKYSGNKKSPPPQGGVVQQLPFEALYDVSSGTTLQIDRYL